MNESVSRTVALRFSDLELEAVVSELCELAATTYVGAEGDPNALLLTDLRDVGDNRSFGAVMVCGRDESDWCDLRLPSEASELLSLLRSWGDDRRRAATVILVGSWHGGGGATTCAFALARPLKAAVFDASGNLNFSAKAPSFGWSQVDQDDMPPGSALISSLPRIRGVPALTCAGGLPLDASDPKVEAAVLACPRAVVIDCGSNVSGLMRLRDRLGTNGVEAKVVLVGGAGDELSAVAVRTLLAMDADAEDRSIDLFTVGRPSSLFQMAIDRFGVRCRRAPRARSTRGWRRIVQSL